MSAVKGRKGFTKKNVLQKLEKISKHQTKRHADHRAAKAAAAAHVKEQVVEKSLVVRVGRRLIHLATFATGMWCNQCNDALSMRFVEDEVIRGLGSIFTVRCHRCLQLVQVATDSTVKTLQPGPDVFSSNCKTLFGVCVG